MKSMFSKVILFALVEPFETIESVLRVILALTVFPLDTIADLTVNALVLDVLILSTSISFKSSTTSPATAAVSASLKDVYSVSPILHTASAANTGTAALNVIASMRQASAKDKNFFLVFIIILLF
ncbi:MAG: hypothetical protein IJY08_06425 [Clostridia bacterium]|nr:hypothetical protein [Clostridia bacterium]